MNNWLSVQQVYLLKRIMCPCAIISIDILTLAGYNIFLTDCIYVCVRVCVCAPNSERKTIPVDRF